MAGILVPTLLPGLLEAIAKDPRYGPVGAPTRCHGRCTCSNNPSWPSCTVCQDWVRCFGCATCDSSYVRRYP